MDRRTLRETAFKMLFEYEFKKDENIDTFYTEALDILEIEDNEYLHTAFYGVIEKKEELDSDIGATAKGWKLSRISKVSLNVMRLCVYEMTAMEDVPFAVSLNEAVELTKKYDDDKAPKFVNGVLNTVAKNKGLKEDK
ncbi:MAG: transcription antitermination factor NusB [Ruminococcaceae bacterium]|nr:transcription antitermination factor NusB [Oscillospiraceae bacterium]